MFPSKTRSIHQIGRGTNESQDSDKTVPVLEKVIVAVRAEKEISRTALAWALTHVVRPGDCIMLLAVISGEKNRGRRFWSFPRLTRDCGSSLQERSADRVSEISECCSQMVLRFQNRNEVSVRVKVVSGLPTGSVAAEAKRAGANWVILDKQLKQEEKCCIEELHCNIVVMKRSQPKVLKLNLGDSNEPQKSRIFSSSTLESDGEKPQHNRIKHSTPVSSPEESKASITRTTSEGTSISNYSRSTSPFFVCEQNPLFERVNKEKPRPINEQIDSSADPVQNPLSSSSILTEIGYHGSIFWIPQNHIVDEHKPTMRNYKNTHNNKPPNPRNFLEKFPQFDRDDARNQYQGLNPRHQRGYVFNSDVRDAVSLSRTSSIPPPLCSLCQHKGPVFGKPPRWFDYGELEDATDGFSEANCLAEGKLGSVHRGVLRDGQVVAVKQLKVASSEGDSEFSRDVEMLSCAQHRNVVMLIGFCTEGRKRVLVYEYVCNGSLDLHLHGDNIEPLDWQSRLNIAIGTARGLRYLHEDCRVGCIVHRDVRPNNILLTHDFEPLVGDFGLARWERQWDIGEDTRSIGTLGYFAPEYTRGEEITEKADVYAFGMVLLELITGRKPMDYLAVSNGRQFPNEWSLPLLPLLEEKSHCPVINHHLQDPRLGTDQLHKFSHQLRAMALAASLCLRQTPESRPPMSKVLRILEGGEGIAFGLDLDSLGNRSGRLRGLRTHPQIESRGTHSRTLSH